MSQFFLYAFYQGFQRTKTRLKKAIPVSAIINLSPFLLRLAMASFFLLACVGTMALHAYAGVVYEEDFNGDWPFGTEDKAWRDYNPDHSEEFEWESLKGDMTCEGNGAIAHTSETHTANAWVASPAFWLSATGTYACSFQQRVGNAGFPEKMGTYIWKGDPSGFRPLDSNAIEIWYSDDVTNTACATQSESFTVSATGNDYHVIFHCTSVANVYLAIWDDLKVTGDPTLVQLTVFSAEPMGSENGILLRWQTASEIDNAGFHIWRGQRADGFYARITDTMIPAEGGPAWGAEYAYEDGDVEPGRTYFYQLEDIDTAGTHTFHGPASAWAGVANIQAGGGDRAATATQEEPVSVKVAIQAGDYAGTPVEYWVAAHTPFGWYSYGAEGWKPGIAPAAVGPLADVAPLETVNFPLPPGWYTFYLAVDDQINGQPDVTWMDTVEVEVE
jgi:hypothetical protein